MSKASCSSTKSLPIELAAMILDHVDDMFFLYAVCRRVSRFWRDEIDSRLLHKVLTQTMIIWPLSEKADPLFRRDQWECFFTRFSDDKKLAYFCPRARLNPAKELNQYSVAPAAYVHFNNLCARVGTHLDHLQDHTILAAPITRIGSDINNMVISDATVPAIELLPGAGEFCFDWKTLFTSIVREENFLAARRAAENISTPRLPPLPEYYEGNKAVISQRYKNFVCSGRTKGLEKTEDAHIRLDMYRRRHPFPWTEKELREWSDRHPGRKEKTPSAYAQWWMRETEDGLDRLERWVGAMRVRRYCEERSMERGFGVYGEERWVERVTSI